MDWLQLSWKLLVVRGVVGIIFGVMAMAWPISTAVALVVLWGAWAVVDGIGTFVAAFSVDGIAPKVLFALLGLIGVAAGFMALARPGVTAVFLTWFLGLWLIARGVIDLVASIAGARVGPMALGILSSLLSIAAGVIFAANPGRSAVALAFWLGLIAMLWGVVFLVAGIMARRETGDQHAAPAATA